MKYITKKDYFKARGIDLTIEFTNVATDNPTKVVDIFLQEVEDFVLQYMQANFETPTEELDPEIMKQVMVYQIDYFRRNGNLTVDADFTGSALAPNAYRLLRVNGYANICSDGSKGYKEVR